MTREGKLRCANRIVIDDSRVTQVASNGRDGGGEKGRKNEKFELHLEKKSVRELNRGKSRNAAVVAKDSKRSYLRRQEWRKRGRDQE
jgi:hypothetical protein